jgi:carbon storage regulator
MLVLTRKITEGITIGPNIRVIVLEIKGGQVRLGIEAPHAIQVHRDEIYARILEENKQAALTDAISLPPLSLLKDLVKKKA